MTDTFVREELEALLTLCCLSNNSMVGVCVAFYERVALFVLVRTRMNPPVPDGELLALGSRDTNVAIATARCSGKVQVSCP